MKQGHYINAQNSRDDNRSEKKVNLKGKLVGADIFADIRLVRAIVGESAKRSVKVAAVFINQTSSANIDHSLETVYDKGSSCTNKESVRLDKCSDEELILVKYSYFK